MGAMGKGGVLRCENQPTGFLHVEKNDVQILSFTLPGSGLGGICHSDDQCQLEDGFSFCDFVIKDAFGRCECKHGRGRNGDGSCKDSFEGEREKRNIKIVVPALAWKK